MRTCSSSAHTRKNRIQICSHWLGGNKKWLTLFRAEQEDEEAWQLGQNFVAVGSVKPAIATLALHVISVPKAKKKAKKKK